MLDICILGQGFSTWGTRSLGRRGNILGGGVKIL